MATTRRRRAAPKKKTPPRKKSTRRPSSASRSRSSKSFGAWAAAFIYKAPQNVIVFAVSWLALMAAPPFVEFFHHQKLDMSAQKAALCAAVFAWGIFYLTVAYPPKPRRRRRRR
jgi:hypothetical protein